MVPSIAMPWQLYVEKVSASSGEFHCMVVCMCEGKSTYFGTLLRSTTILNLFFSFVLLMMRIVHPMGGHSLLDILKNKLKLSQMKQLKRCIRLCCISTTSKNLT